MKTKNNNNKNPLWRIDMTLTEGRTAKFEYSDHFMAREHFEQLRAVLVIGGQAIKTIKLEQVEE